MCGILPYTRVNPDTGEYGTEIWVMISQEKYGKRKDRNTWDMFAGAKDPHETSRQAAAREGVEESCEMFGTIEQIAEKMIPINGSDSQFLLNADELMTKKEIYEKCTSEAYLERLTWSQYEYDEYQEKSAVKWVQLSSLIDACVNHNGLLKADNIEMKIRRCFLICIKKNKEYLSNNFLNTELTQIKAQKIAATDTEFFAEELKITEKLQYLEKKTEELPEDRICQISSHVIAEDKSNDSKNLENVAVCNL